MKNILIKGISILLLPIVLISCGPSAVIVKERPPAPVVVRPVIPAPGYIWIEGNYIRSGRGYIYKPGYWVAPSGKYHAYRPGYWAPRGKKYYWHRGR